MLLSDVDKILHVFHSKDWSNQYDVHDETWKKNSWLKIGFIDEFNFIRDVINKDLQKIDNQYKVTDWITFLIYKENDFFGVHKDDYVNDVTSNKKIIYTGGYLLNNDYEGGEFIIDKKKLEVDVGELFLFARDKEHEVKKVINGVRYSLHFGVEILMDKKTII